jgi:hypothetical protein
MSPVVQRTMVYLLLRVATVDLQRGKPYGQVVLDLIEALERVFDDSV